MACASTVIFNNGSFSVRVIDSIEDVVGLRDLWREFVCHPEADIDLFLGLLGSRDEILRPHVMVLETSDGTPLSMLLGRIEKRRLDLGFGHPRLSLPPVRCLTVIGGGLFRGSEDSISALLESVITCLRSRQADVAYFHRLDTESNLYRHITKAGGPFGRDYWPAFNDHWKVSLPNSYATFIQRRSANTRRNIKRYAKRFCEAFGDQIGLRYFTDSASIELLLKDTEAIAQKTYHRGMQVGFINDEETRHRMTLYAKQGRLRAYLLYVGERPVAFWNGFFHERTFYTWTTGYDPEYHDFRPGLFLLQKLFEDLCNERRADTVDFGPGDAQYKRDWCDQNELEVSAYLFAPNLRGTLFNILRTTLLGCSSAARWAVTKTGILKAIKKSWRSHLSQQARQKSSDV